MNAVTAQDEHFRAVMQAKTADGEITSLIVTKQGRAVWVSMHGSWRGTVELTDPEAAHFIGLVMAAREA